MSAAKKKKKSSKKNTKKKNNSVKKVNKNKVNNSSKKVNENNKNSTKEIATEKNEKEELKEVEEKVIKEESKKTLENKKESKKSEKKAKKDTKKNNGEEKKEVKKASQKEEKKPKDASQIIKSDDTPEYVKDMLKKKKRRMLLIILGIIIALSFIMFSTFFALFNTNKDVMQKGVKIRNIEVSNLSKEDAKTVVKEIVDKELSQKINLKYNEYITEFAVGDIEFSYLIDEAVDKAYNYGKVGNVFLNNYQIIGSMLFGKNISLDYDYNEELFNTYIENVNANLPGVVVEPSYYIEGTNLIVTKGADGVKIDEQLTKDLIIKTLVNRKDKEINSDIPEEIMLPVEKVEASEIDMKKIYEEVHQEPQDAYFETEPYAIYADKDGIDLKISIDEAQNEINYNYKDEYIFELEITKAAVTINDLGTEAFPYVISNFSTKYDASNINRSTNLEIAARKINGTVIMPGEVFSYNNVVGQRTIEEGYKDAKIYADGGVVDGLAGGICQISSTLYNAVLLADLEIVERFNHSYTTSYLAAGRDATVVWGIKDFKFKNSRNYPIKIEASVKNGIAEFTIHGMQEEQDYDEIKILPYTTSSIPYGTQTIPDPTLAPGATIVTQGGHVGYKVTTYKAKYLNGVEISRELLSNDTYQPMTAIVRVGIAPQ